MLSGASVGALFLGGMVPAILIGTALMIYTAVIAGRQNFPRGAERSLAAFISVTISAVPALLAPVILLGGIYSGIFTPTEAGAVAGFYALLAAIFIYRALGFAELRQVLIMTVRQTGSISLIVGASFGVSFVLVNEGIPNRSR